MNLDRRLTLRLRLAWRRRTARSAFYVDSSGFWSTLCHPSRPSSRVFASSAADKRPCRNGGCSCSSLTSQRLCYLCTEKTGTRELFSWALNDVALLQETRDPALQGRRKQSPIRGSTITANQETSLGSRARRTNSHGASRVPWHVLETRFFSQYPIYSLEFRGTVLFYIRRNDALSKSCVS